MTWKQRLKAVGVTGRALAGLLGVAAETVSISIRRDAPERYIAQAIRGLEIMTPEQRERWLGGDDDQAAGV